MADAAGEEGEVIATVSVGPPLLLNVVSRSKLVTPSLLVPEKLQVASLERL